MHNLPLVDGSTRSIEEQSIALSTEQTIEQSYLFAQVFDNDVCVRTK